MNNFRYSPNPDAIQEDKSTSLTHGQERMCNVRQVRSPENTHTPYASRSHKQISNRALVSKCKTAGRGTVK